MSVEGNPLESSIGPALVEFMGAIYAFFVLTDGNDGIMFSQFDGQGSWTAPAPVGPSGAPQWTSEFRARCRFVGRPAPRRLE